MTERIDDPGLMKELVLKSTRNLELAEDIEVEMESARMRSQGNG